MFETIIASLMLILFGGYVIFSERKIRNIKDTHLNENRNLYQKIHKEIEDLSCYLLQKEQIEIYNRPKKTPTIEQAQTLAHILGNTFKNTYFGDLEHGDFLCYEDCIEKLESIVFEERTKQINNEDYIRMTGGKYKHSTLRAINSKK